MQLFLFSLVLWISTINSWLLEERACGAAGAKAAAEELEPNQQIRSRVNVHIGKNKPKEKCGQMCFLLSWQLSQAVSSCLDAGRSTTSTLNRFSALQQSGALSSTSDSDRRVPQRYSFLSV